MDPQQLPLRDIHLPDPIGWWPMAPGWWLLLISVLGLLITAVWLWRALTRQSLKKIARRELNTLQERYDLSAADKVRQLSILLRRISISAYPRAEVASLTGNAWLGFLENHLKDRRFLQGPGRLLAEAPYRPVQEIDLGPLFRLCREWIERLPKERS